MFGILLVFGAAFVVVRLMRFGVIMFRTSHHLGLGFAGRIIISIVLILAYAGAITSATGWTLEGYDPEIQSNLAWLASAFVVYLIFLLTRDPTRFRSDDF